MKKKLILGFLLVSSLARANAQLPCPVDYPKNFQRQFRHWIQGKCKTNFPPWITSAKEYFPELSSVSTLYFADSMEIGGGPLVIPDGAPPLLMVAGPGAKVRFSTPLIIKSSSVILENLIWQDVSSTALRMEGNNIFLKNVKVIQSGSNTAPALLVAGNNFRFEKGEIRESRADGLAVQDFHPADACSAEWVPLRPRNIAIVESPIHHNKGYGMVANGFGVEVIGSEQPPAAFYNNGKAAILVENPISNISCANPRLHTLYLGPHLSFYENELFGEKRGLEIKGTTLPAPQGLVAIPDFKGDLLVSGYIPLSRDAHRPYSLGKISFRNVSVDVYANFLNEGRQGKTYLGSTEEVNDDGTFELFVDKKRLPEGHGLVVMALASDKTLRVTSDFSAPTEINAATDTDGDGLSDIKEDGNSNGRLDLGETDPRNPDTDQDGLSDGEELAAKLDPSDFDTDGDCLPDGVEKGVTEEKVRALRAKNLGPQKYLVLLESCWGDHSREYERCNTPPDNGVWEGGSEHCWDNMIGMFDKDPATTTNPKESDTDNDGLRDSEEDQNKNGATDEKESGAGTESNDSDHDGISDGDEIHLGLDPANPDTDGDGLKDGEELQRWRSDPKNCDSDGDSLGDGLEAGVIHPEAAIPECRGLQPAKTNFRDIKQLDPLDDDSDKDGLKDGEEDANHNGWLDFNETDPTVADTDGDGVEDGLEKMLDRDGDGFVDFELQHLKNGEKCSPPTDKTDVDCDGVINGRDEDSDEDGCLDSEEGTKDINENGILDIWEAAAKSCAVPPRSSGGSSGGNGGGTSSTNTSDKEPLLQTATESPPSRGGGACQLVKGANPDWGGWILILFVSIRIIIARPSESSLRG